MPATRLLFCLGVVALWLLLAGCDNNSPTPGPAVINGILSFDQSVVINQNKQHGGNASADPRACGATGLDRGFLRELTSHGIDDAKVKYEWAPIVPGPNPSIPTINQPQFFAQGQIMKWYPPGSDVMFAHPFGLDESMDIFLDPAFLDLNYVPPKSDNNIPLHAELEQGIWQHHAFGYFPQIGDRVLLLGAWIMDCGHPETYGSEIHPPTFLAFARNGQDGLTTTSLAFVNPYRASQLYNPDASLANDFSNDARFTNSDTKPFPGHLKDEAVNAALHGSLRPLEAHALVEPTQFNPISWYVCAPSPRPAGATLKYTYRFTMRTGVAIQPIPHDDIGCIQFLVIMNSDYKPMPITPMHVPWSWDEMKTNSGLDVHQLLLTAVGDPLGCCNIPLKKDPIIDLYPALQVRSDDSRDTPIDLFTSADDQPYPFYGRARVYWELPPPPPTPTQPAGARPQMLIFPGSLDFPDGGPYEQTLTLDNSFDQSGRGMVATVSSVNITGANAADFGITGDACSGTTLSLGQHCDITITFHREGTTGSRVATLTIVDTAGASWTIPLSGAGLVP